MTLPIIPIGAEGLAKEDPPLKLIGERDPRQVMLEQRRDSSLRFQGPPGLTRAD